MRRGYPESARMSRRAFHWAIVSAITVAAIGFVVTSMSGPGAEEQPDAAAGGLITADTLTALLAASEEGAFERPPRDWRLTLPDDHGAHPTMRAETWMIAAQLEDEDGDAIGVTFTLSRFGLRAEPSASEGSVWDVHALYGAYAMLTREGEGRVRSEERLSRGAGAAGYDHGAREVWLDDWRLSYGEGPRGRGLALRARVDGVPIALALAPAKGARSIDGEDDAPLQGFTMPRMRVEGRIGSGASQTVATGYAWLDRAWGELPAPGGPLAYDRLILHLNDGTDVSVVRTRRRDGRGGATLDGVLVDPAGATETVSDEVIEMRPASDPPPDRDGGQALDWTLVGAGLDLRIEPLVRDRANASSLLDWGGTVAASGRHDGAAVEGLGMLQLSGYETP